jgi:predicted  nucleic acid-binding Zn-ribbon protein
MNRYEDLQNAVTAIQDDLRKFYEKDNKAAGTRARKGLQDLRNLAQEIRVEIQDKKNAEG